MVKVTTLILLLACLQAIFAAPCPPVCNYDNSAAEATCPEVLRNIIYSSTHPCYPNEYYKPCTPGTCDYVDEDTGIAHGETVCKAAHMWGKKGYCVATLEFANEEKTCPALKELCYCDCSGRGTCGDGTCHKEYEDCATCKEDCCSQGIIANWKWKGSYEDFSLNGNNLVSFGPVPVTFGTTDGRDHINLWVDGVDNYLYLSQLSPFALGSQWTITVWVYHSSTYDEVYHILGIYEGEKMCYLFHSNEKSSQEVISLRWNTYGDLTYEWRDNFEPGWRHFALTYDNNEVQLYVDKKNVRPKRPLNPYEPGTFSLDSLQVLVGRYKGLNPLKLGQMLLINRVVSASELEEIYDGKW